MRQSHYDYTIALITVMFVGTVICALGYRRRLATAMGHLEDENSGLPMQMQVDQIDVSGVKRVESVPRDYNGASALYSVGVWSS